LIPFLVEKAVRISLAGKPGAVYLDLPGDVYIFRIDSYWNLFRAYYSTS